MSAQLFLTLIQVKRKSRLQYNKALWRWVSGEAVGVDTLAAVVTILHTGDSGYRVAFYWIGAAVELGSPPGV